MNNLTVTKDPDGQSGILSIPLRSVDYLLCESEKKRMLVYVGDVIYYMMGTVKYWETAIANTGDYRFVKVDRNTLVNIVNIQILDTKYRKAYFGSNKKFGCEFAHHKFSEYEQIIKSFNKSVSVI
ncbi:MAG: LytTR family transcriptional regulator DNA-binding domain-containing protein [Candidatus Pristimantibacillus lignocellulolyticus]|uniref:LytTR family transcriptional regulator DNA-binding domain-containing protein n=1 Tax=Candidatus Pristimantibacillus lignocellulolyticus TaxID=2994561 RepID=A0A9J6ZF83_9BACL|nr:MAG: LytTR family transcriptional regulator DNA-binding domain-containing protein [Candidatus Pristimantibacillus lignocellulolyticus]